MNKTNDTAFLHVFTLLILGLTVTGILAFVLAQIVARNAEKDEIVSKNVVDRIQIVGLQNVTGSQITVTSVPGLLPESIEATNLNTTTNEIKYLAANTSVQSDDSVNLTKSGQDVYGAACAVCHGAGVAGAPKFGDSVAWKTRIAKGNDKLYANAINGYVGKAGVMPAKGGRPDLSNEEVESAVDYMTNSSL